MMGLEIAVTATRFVTAVFLGILSGLILSTFLGIMAYYYGYNPDPIFNVSGLAITIYTSVWLWKYTGLRREAAR